MALFPIGPSDIDILGVTWDHLPLTYELIRGDNVSQDFWDAIDPIIFFEWNLCLQLYFSVGYPTWGFSELLTPVVSGTADITITVDGDSDPSTNPSKTHLVVDPSTGIVSHAYICLKGEIFNTSGGGLDEAAGTLAHHLGHALCLGHANENLDIMDQDQVVTINIASTLDAEAVGEVFSWFDLAGISHPVTPAGTLPSVDNIADPIAGSASDSSSIIPFGQYPVKPIVTSTGTIVSGGPVPFRVTMEDLFSSPIGGIPVELIISDNVNLPQLDGFSLRGFRGITGPSGNVGFLLSPDLTHFRLGVIGITAKSRGLPLAGYPLPAMDVEYVYDTMHTITVTPAIVQEFVDCN
jgi:hypothetical protein